MWNPFKRKKTIHPPPNAPPGRSAGTETGRLQTPAGPPPAVGTSQEACPDTAGPDAVNALGREQLSKLAKTVARYLIPLIQSQTQDAVNNTAALVFDGHARLESRISTAVEQISEAVASRMVDDVREFEQVVAQHLDPLAESLRTAVENKVTDQLSAVGNHVADVCSASAQQAVLRPVVDQILALLDRMGDERTYLTWWYRKDPELGLHLGCRQLHERYDGAVQSFRQEIYILLRSLDVHPLDGCAGPFNPRHQQIVGVEATTNPELDGHVARAVRPGFLWGGMILRPEQIVVFKKEKKS